MTAEIVTGWTYERHATILLARIVGTGRTPITQASLSTIKYEVWLIDTPAEFRSPSQQTDEQFTPKREAAAASIDIATTVYDTLQIGPDWTVTAAAPAAIDATTLYVDALAGNLRNGLQLTFGSAAGATLAAQAAAGDRSLTIASLTAPIDLGATADVAGGPCGDPLIPAQTSWQQDRIGYNFRWELPAGALPELPLTDYPDNRWYRVDLEFAPVSGSVFGLHYEIESRHRFFGKTIG